MESRQEHTVAEGETGHEAGLRGGPLKGCDIRSFAAEQAVPSDLSKHPPSLSCNNASAEGMLEFPRPGRDQASRTGTGVRSGAISAGKCAGLMYGVTS